MLSTKNLSFPTERGKKKKKKLMPRYCGPFKILERIRDTAFKLELPATMKVHPVFHASLLSTYHHSPRTQPPLAPLIVNGQEEWIIEEIIAHRDMGKVGDRVRTEYLVKWKGYELENNSWEPADALEECEALDC